VFLRSPFRRCKLCGSVTHRRPGVTVFHGIKCGFPATLEGVPIHKEFRGSHNYHPSASFTERELAVLARGLPQKAVNPPSCL
jgi:hypothetical protein